MRAIAYQSWSGILQNAIDAGRDNPNQTFANADLIASRSSALFAILWSTPMGFAWRRMRSLLSGWPG